MQTSHRVMIVVMVAFGATTGAALGIGSYTFFYAKGLSYMGNDAATCANCHVMQDKYDAWCKSSHHGVAVCNDCHTPHDFVGKYYTKGLNGYHHSLAFTTGNFHEPIQIKERNLAVTEAACRSCHSEVVQEIDYCPREKGELSCVRCHRSVGHLEE